LIPQAFPHRENQPDIQLVELNIPSSHVIGMGPRVQAAHSDSAELAELAYLRTFLLAGSTILVTLGARLRACPYLW